MATMVKEKRREKKKSKEKPSTKATLAFSTNAIREEITPSISQVSETTLVNDIASCNEILSQEKSEEVISENISLNKRLSKDVTHDNTSDRPGEPVQSCTEQMNVTPEIYSAQTSSIASGVKIKTAPSIEISYNTGTDYKDLNARLERIQIPVTAVPLSREQELAVEAVGAYIKEETGEETLSHTGISVAECVMEADETINEVEDLSPSAPMIEFEEPYVETQYQEITRPEVPRLISMSLEEALGLYGGREIAEVMAMSEREEAAVEAGPLSGPEHPLVDLLSTFKRSLIAVKTESGQLTRGIKEEEKFRNLLWKVEKREISHSESCPPCKRTVHFSGSYEVATLQKDKLQVARIRLQGLLRDLQDSYCHHQHVALLTYCQIKEFLAETIQSNKSEIREALCLVLEALKLSDSAPATLTSVLKRWAAALAAALLDARDLRQLLFLIHLLFRQTRSVRWAARVIDVQIGDSPARALALLDLLLARPGIDAAVECTEDKEEDWEEVDKDGGGGAVSDGTLRERDMLALLRALPLRGIVSKILLFTQADLRHARDYSWGDFRGGHDVLRACCGVRVLLHVARRACSTHPRYTRVRRVLHRLALSAVHALQATHDHARSSYAKGMELKIQAELEAVFASGLGLLEPRDVHRLPAGLLSLHAARDYCVGHILNLHETSSMRLESLAVEMPALACYVRVGIVTQAAVDRPQDYELARIVLEFLFQIGVRRQTTPCSAGCRAAARDALPRLLAAHTHLYSAALLLVADISTVEKLEPCTISWLRVEGWRAGPEDAAAAAADWARRCPHLLPPLLLGLDYTPHTGLSLESQLAIGSWLCSHVSTRSPSEVEEWCWSVLRKLRVHRACWGLEPEAPPPDPVPNSLFEKAYALMASSVGHCVPVICSEGVDALCALAACRVSMALHCLAPVMLLLAPAHESISLTPRFSEFFTSVVNASPSLMQRALGRGGLTGADLLLRLVVEQLADDHCGVVPRGTVGRAWVTALWRAQLPAGAAVLDAALAALPALAASRHHILDEHAAQLARAQDEETLQQVTQAMKLSASAPLVCCSALRAWHTQRELLPGLYPRLLDALHAQHLTAQRIHVDNALKLLGAHMNAEELVIYRCAAAVLTAPPQHPAHLELWEFLMHLYLQRPPVNTFNVTPPVGPHFFSGLIKSRTLAQLKRRLQECITYHDNEIKLEAAKRASKPSVSVITRSPSRSPDDNLLPTLSVNDLSDESSDSSDPDSDSEEDKRRENKNRDLKEETPAPSEVAESSHLLAYNTSAKEMLSKFAQWLEDPRTGAVPHMTEIARHIPERALKAGWKHYSDSRLPACSTSEDREPFPLPPVIPPLAPETLPTPFQRAVDTLLAIKERRGRRPGRAAIRSPVEDVDFKDTRSLLALVDKHLKVIEKLAQEWCSEVSRISALDVSLLKLVGELRVPRPLPEMRLKCGIKCRTLCYTHPDREWCISFDAQKGIKDNRTAALAGMRRLAKPRPQIAHTAAALLTIARRMSGGSATRTACSRSWVAAGGVSPQCAPAVTALTAFFDVLAERWLSRDGGLCAELISEWCSGRRPLSPLQQSLFPALVVPARLPPPQLQVLHAALLKASLPPHVAFSCLSKFEMGKWAASVDTTARQAALEILRDAIRRWGADKERDMVVELLGVQSTTICGPEELSLHTLIVADQIMAGTWPSSQASHLVATAQRVAHDVSFDQLGHLLRSLGVSWWETRARARARHRGLAAHAPHVAALLLALHRPFVASAKQLSYAPERIAVYAWSSLVESWGAWVLPHATPPLLSSMVEEEAYTPMLQRFHDAIKQVMAECPGTEEYLLNQIFEWTIQTYLAVQSESSAQESRVQMSALLVELGTAPWQSHQWLRGKSLEALLQVCQCNDKEMYTWASVCVGGQKIGTWLHDAGHEELPPRLALLLYLFTRAPLQLPEQLLEEAKTLPWHRLPEAALEEALDRFFMEHHSLVVPYHELPQFRVILAASEIAWSPHSGVCLHACSRHKRACLVSTWLRAASAPALAPHVPGYQRAQLDLINTIAPHLEGSEGEIEDLMSRAMVIMCIEPAAAAALPVWERWVRQSGGRACAACVRALGTLTAFEYFAPLADAAVAAYISTDECGGWASMPSLWRACPWREAGPLCARSRLHAAYGTLLAHVHSFQAAKAALLALLAADIDFVENEIMVGVWICVACRFARVCGLEGEEGECRGAAAALLSRWAEPTRRSLLKMVTLHADTDRPQPKHRALCLFAMCVLSGGSEKCAREFEAHAGAVGAAGGGGAGAWARSPRPRRLPRLALRLFPNAEAYFRHELDAAPPDVAGDAGQ